MNKLLLTTALAPFLATSLHAAVYTELSSFQASSSVSLKADFEGVVDFAYSLEPVSKPYSVNPTISITSNAGLMIVGSGLLGGGTDGLTTDGYSDTMTISFSGGTDAVGFDYFLGSSWSEGTFSIKVYGATDNLLYDSGAVEAPVRVEWQGGAEPAFFGIEGVGSIHRVELGGAGVTSVGVDNLYTTSLAAVPEPSSLVLTSVMLGGALLRRKRVK